MMYPNNIGNIMARPCEQWGVDAKI